MFKSKKAFTLPELLVIIAVIGIISGVTFSWIQGGRAKARDVKRISDLEILRTALKMYNMDYHGYPRDPNRCCIDCTEGSCPSGCQECVEFNEAMEPYLSQIPKDPLYGKGEDTPGPNGKLFAYQYYSDGSNFWVKACLEKGTGCRAEGTYITFMAGLATGKKDDPRLFPNPIVEFISSQFDVSEDDGEATITVGFQEDIIFDEDVSVYYRTIVGGSAIEYQDGLTDYDYWATSGELTFKANTETRKTFKIKINEDDLPEDSETVKLNLYIDDFNHSNCSLGRDNAELLISDSDSINFNFESLGYPNNDESVGSVRITVNLTGPAPLGAYVHYNTIDVTASGTDPYTNYDYFPPIPNPKKIVFNEGSTSAYFDIAINNDEISEDKEFFIVRLTDPGGGTLGPRNETIVEIKDDDSEKTFIRIIRGSSGHDQDKMDIFYSLQKTVDGYVMAGKTTSESPEFVYEGNIFVVKIVPDVNDGLKIAWKKAIGSAVLDQALSIETIENSYVLAGETASRDSSYDGFLIKIESNGEDQRTKLLGDRRKYDSIAEIVETPHNGDRGFIVVGTTETLGDKDIFIAKFRPDMEIEWGKILRATGNEDTGFSIKQTLDGGYIITGTTQPSLGTPSYPDIVLIKTDENGEVTFAKKIRGGTEGVSVNLSDIGKSVIETSEGGFLVVGSTDSGEVISGEPSGLYIVKLRANGSLDWDSKLYRGTNFISGTANSVFENEIERTYIISGYIQVNEDLHQDRDIFDLYVAGIHAGDGHVVWDKKIKINNPGEFNEAYNYINNSRVLSDNSFIIAGSESIKTTMQPFFEDTNAFIGKLDSSGNIDCLSGETPPTSPGLTSYTINPVVTDFSNLQSINFFTVPSFEIINNYDRFEIQKPRSFTVNPCG